MRRGYWALITIHLKLAYREKTVLFFTYVFPLIFLFGFGQFMGARSGAMMTRVVAMVLVIGLLGTGLFGGGLRAVQERELNILRRYKVTPISPLPLLVASMVTGWLLCVSSAAMVLALSRLFYGMPWPDRWISLLALVTLGACAIRAIGLIVSAIANSMAEANIVIQLLYMPMLLLSGATFPVSVMPVYMQMVAQFLPASYLNSGMQHVLLRSQGLGTGLGPVAALVASTAAGLWISTRLFRWEKEEKIAARSKAWVAAAFVPFLLLGGWQAWSREQINDSKLLDREIRRKYTRLIRGARIFAGDGRVIERGAVLLKDGRIERVWEGEAPSPESLSADAVEAVGKTVMPGLIDVHVHLGAPGGAMARGEAAYDVEAAMKRALSAYLYSGVIAVRSAGDFLSQAVEVRESVNAALHLGAETFLCGPLFTAPGGHGTEYFRGAPDWLREMSEAEFTRIPATPEEARRQVRELERRGVNAIKAVLEAGAAGITYQRMDLSLIRAVAEEAASQHLPLVVHTGNSHDVGDAIDAGALGIEHGSMRDPIPDEMFARMKQRGMFYDPALSVVEAFADLRDGRLDLLNNTLVEQVAPPGMLAATRKAYQGEQTRPWREKLAQYTADLAVAMDNLARAWKAGVTVVTGTDSGNPLLVHGPAIHRELRLWVQAGVPAPAALRAATYDAARLLGVSDRAGLVKPGYDASLVIVDGNPLQDIAVTERLSAVFLKGERVDRPGLFDQK